MSCTGKKKWAKTKDYEKEHNPFLDILISLETETCAFIYNS